MKEQFVTYEIAIALKELGFDEPCFGYYIPAGFENSGKVMFKQHLSKSPIIIGRNTEPWSHCLAPLWQQVIDWFREKYEINCVVGYTDDDKKEFMAIIDKPNQDIDYNMNSTKSYQEAREQAILKAIELIKNHML